MNTDTLPRATWWAHAYNIVNTMCWAIVTGVPIQLLLKDLHASATIIGILVAVPSGANLLQLWVAPMIDRLGYKRFALLGWPLRIGVVFAMALLALAMPWLEDAGVDAVVLVIVLLALQVVFNGLRAASNAAFMPWYSVLIPEHQRGQFLARDNAAGAFAGILVAFVTWAVFAWNPPGVYALLFAGAALFGILAIACVQHLPDVPPPPARTDGSRGPWREVMTPAFVGQLGYNLLWTLALSGSGVCWIGVIREVGHAPASVPALMPMVGAWTALALLPIAGRVVDRAGNRPALGVGTVLAATHLVLWACLAKGWIPFGWPALIVIQTFAACGGSLFALAAARLLMSVVAPESRATGFALHGVVCGVAGAIFPIGWGLLFDLLVAHGLSRPDGYAVLYAITGGLAFLAAALVHRLPDPGAQRMRDFVRILGGEVAGLFRRRPVASPGPAVSPAAGG